MLSLEGASRRHTLEYLAIAGANLMSPARALGLAQGDIHKGYFIQGQPGASPSDPVLRPRSWTLPRDLTSI